MKRIFFLVIIILLAITIIGFTSVTSFFDSPVDSANAQPVVFVVAQGEPLKDIAKRLQQEGMIHNDLFFLLQVRRLNLASKIQAGDFRLTKSMSTTEIANALTQGTLDIWVQILEGWRAEEVASTLEAKLPSYDSSWIQALKKEEGYLFPDTYLIPRDADIAMIVRILRSNFDAKIEPYNKSIGKNGLTLEESVILASIVEREALFDEDRGIIAGILLNRLNIGMALQADATVQYAIGYQRSENDWWKKSLTRDDLAINSPYNTYKFPGLPPKPISSPGLASLQAVLNPTDTDYIYYLHDSSGKAHYGETLDDHNSNIERYL